MGMVRTKVWVSVFRALGNEEDARREKKQGRGALSEPVQGGPVWFLTMPVQLNFGPVFDNFARFFNSR